MGMAREEGRKGHRQIHHTYNVAYANFVIAQDASQGYSGKAIKSILKEIPRKISSLILSSLPLPTNMKTKHECTNNKEQTTTVADAQAHHIPTTHHKLNGNGAHTSYPGAIPQVLDGAELPGGAVLTQGHRSSEKFPSRRSLAAAARRGCSAFGQQ